MQGEMRALVFALALGASCTAAHAAITVIHVNFDEDGHGTANGSPLPFTVEPDPTGGVVSSNVLVYTLPYAGTLGDILVHEGPAGPIEDVVRFDGQFHMIYYSTNSPGLNSLADTLNPPNPLLTNTVDVAEGGAPGDDFFDYTPTTGQPGFDPVNAVIYHALSDTPAVPEPASLALLGAGAAALLRRRRR